MNGENPSEPAELEVSKSGVVLVLSPEGSPLGELSSDLREKLPWMYVSRVETFEQCKTFLKGNAVDLVISELEALGDRPIEFIHGLKINDSQPFLIVTAKSDDPDTISKIYDAGCQKYLSQSVGWSDELSRAAHHLIRLRKLQEENTKLIAKLTEANLMLEEKNRRLDEFSATVAHDIRGPLGGVVMKLEYLLDKYAGTIDSRFEGLLNKALSSSQRLTDIVQAMYEFAKLGAKAANMGPVNLKQLIEEVLSDMHFEESRQINIGLSDLPMVWGCPELLRRVFINLIGNAVKYNDKPEVEINIGCSGIAERSLSSFAEIFVEDNGPGMDDATKAHVFKFFTRGSSGSDGLGVGLSVVQRIIELHYGAISVESSPGKGAKFVLSLPLGKIAI